MQVWLFYFPECEQKGADQTALMRRLLCAYVVRMQHNQFFSRPINVSRVWWFRHNFQAIPVLKFAT